MFKLKENNKKSLIKLNIARDGKGISKKEPLNPSGLKRFFITLKNNMSKLMLVNIIMVLGNAPILFFIATLSGYTKTAAMMPINDIAQNLSGIFMIEGVTPSGMSLYALEGIQSSILLNTTLTYVFYALGSLTLLTFGIINTGTAYVLRNMAMGDAVFVWSDFWYAVKRNWKQALPFGIFDGIVNVILIFNIYSTMTSPNFLVSLMF